MDRDTIAAADEEDHARALQRTLVVVSVGGDRRRRRRPVVDRAAPLFDHPRSMLVLATNLMAAAAVGAAMFTLSILVAVAIAGRSATTIAVATLVACVATGAIYWLPGSILLKVLRGNEPRHQAGPSSDR